jgi:hypothetical protein
VFPWCKILNLYVAVSKSLDAAQSTLAGIELMHMLRKEQLEEGIGQALTAAEQFSSLAA